jgi:hypothetical protein
MSTPADFPRRLPLAVTDPSPQVLTETIRALAQQERAAPPTSVRLLTTEEGARRARSLLEGTAAQPKAVAVLAASLDLPLNRRIRSALGAAARPSMIDRIGRRPASRYRLDTPPEAISIITANGTREAAQ